MTRIIKWIVSTLIKGYQYAISPLLGGNCRFYPSCSEYSKICFEKYGVGVATYKSVKRICKCHPFHPGGEDLP